MIRAWWSSRSSKSSPRHFVSGGRFDSYPLRHPRARCLRSQSQGVLKRSTHESLATSAAIPVRRQGAAGARRHRASAADRRRRGAPRACRRCGRRKPFPTLAAVSGAHPRAVCSDVRRVPHPAGHQRHRHPRAHQLRPGAARRRRHRRAVGDRIELQQPRIRASTRRRARRPRGVSRARPRRALRRRGRDGRQQQRGRAGADPPAFLPARPRTRS